MKNNLETPSGASKDQADDADLEAADLEAAEVEVDTDELGEFWEPPPDDMGDFDKLAHQFGVGGPGLRIAKFIFVLFGIVVGIAGLVFFGVVINTFLVS